MVHLISAWWDVRRLVLTGACALGSIALATPVSAAEVDIPVGPHRYIIDWGYDDLGDEVSTSATLAVGDGDRNLDKGEPEYRVVMEFDISSFHQDIAAASEIWFSIEFERYQGNAQDFMLVAINPSANEDGILTASDYSAAGTTIRSWELSTLDNGTTITADVTQAVKDDYLAGQDWSAFRLQVIDSTAHPIDNAFNMSRFVRDTAVLSVVPEPTSLVVLGLGGVALLARRRGGMA